MHTTRLLTWKLGTALLTSLVCGSLEAQICSPSWRLRTTSGPGPRYAHALVFDSARNVAVLYGGLPAFSSDSVLSETWEWDGKLWAFRTASGPHLGGGSAGVTAAFDSTRARMVLVCRNALTAAFETWEWDGTTWTLMATANSGGPPYENAMVFDEARHVSVIYGQPGIDGTWVWDGGSWAAVATTGPSYRTLNSMAYDSVREVTVLFGGWGGTASLGDTWEWNGQVWALRASTGPAPRVGASMTYDRARGRVVLFGGRDGATAQTFFGDMWTWDGAVWTQEFANGPSARVASAAAYDTYRQKILLYGGTRSPNIFSDTWTMETACPLLGDANCDGNVNNFDIDAFVLVILNPLGYAAAYPNCPILVNDVNRDGAANNFDIDQFVACMLDQGCP